MDAGGVQAMLSCLLNCNRVSLMKEVIWSLSNIAAGTTEQVAALLSAGEQGPGHACVRTGVGRLLRA